MKCRSSDCLKTLPASWQHRFQRPDRGWRMSRQPSDFHEACHDPRCCRKPLWKTVDHPALVDAGTVRRCVACIEIKGWLPRGSIGRSLFLGLHGLFGLSIFCTGLGSSVRAPDTTPARHARAASLADGCFPQARAVLRVLLAGSRGGGSRFGQTAQVWARVTRQQRLLADRPACGGGSVSSLLGG